MAFPSHLLLDPLYCQEDPLDDSESVAEELPLLSHSYDHHLLTSEAEESEADQWVSVLSSLSGNESNTYPALPLDHPIAADLYLRSARKTAVEWVLTATARHGFSAVTALLAVNFLDRCFLGGGLRLQEDKPWMGRLSAVACLSLAAKLEETRVPLLLDLQVAPAPAAEEDTGYVFEPKTVKRMELLVLSTLGWRMNPVTPLSFVRHAFPKLLSGEQQPFAIAHLRELWSRCEAALLSAIADRRWVRHPPSAWAAAALAHAMGQPPGCSETHHLASLLNVPKERMEGCYGLIVESMGNGGIGVGSKRKHHSSSSFYCCYSSPPSPNGVVGSCFSYDSSSSNDSWAMWPSSVSSSPELPPPLFKRPNCIATDY